MSVSPVLGHIPRIAIWMVVFTGAVSSVFAQSQSSSTTAVRALETWLKSFNSADPEEISAFHEQFDPQHVTGFVGTMREHTGGFKLVAVEQSGPGLVTFVVREKRTEGDRARGTLRLLDSAKDVIASFELFVVLADFTAAQPGMDGAARARVIEAASARLNESYVFPDVARNMAGSGHSGTAGAESEEAPHECLLKITPGVYK